MMKAPILSYCWLARLSAMTGLTLCLQAPLVAAQNPANSQSNGTVAQKGQSQPISLTKYSQPTYDSYILGPGDGLQIELLDLPELSGIFSIGPDGTLYLPRLRSVYVEGLTVEDLRQYLTEEFKAYVLEPQVYIRPVVYRPIRIYVGGEVKRPGYYTIAGARTIASQAKQLTEAANNLGSLGPINRSTQNIFTANSDSKQTLFTSIPTVFDAIRIAQGITPYSDLTQVQVTRNRSKGRGGGRMRTSLNILSLLTQGDESQNIRLFDDDVVRVVKSDDVNREQLLKAGQSNLSPQFIEVFVSGRVNNPGGISLPQASTLNQAVAMAGGTSLIKGKVEFVRFTNEGKTERRLFNYDPGAAAGASNNPLLSSGDLIRVRDSILSATTTVLEEITAPAVGVYTMFSLIEGFSK